MKATPEDIETSALTDALVDAWDFEVDTIDYAAVGFGSYHWVASDVNGTRAFVTVDDLHDKPWLGDSRDSVFDGLGRAFRTALALRQGGLGFVVAPIPTTRGDVVRRLGSRHTIALFPFVDGQVGRDDYDDMTMRATVVTMIAELHRATPAVASLAPSVGLDLPGRRRLDASLQEADQTWSGGPFSEPARQALVLHASDVADLLALADRLSADVASRGSPWVVTHGEPHPGNVMRTDERQVLLDWDTVALAPPERDLWMLVGDTADEATLYADATGHHLDQAAVDFFRLTWDLNEVAAFINLLRSPHRRSVDTELAFETLMECLLIRDPWAALL